MNYVAMLCLFILIAFVVCFSRWAIARKQIYLFDVINITVAAAGTYLLHFYNYV